LKIVVTLLAFFLFLDANVSDAKLKQMVARMVIIGFDGTKIDHDSSITKDLQNYNLGGVILFDVNYQDRSKQKNIQTPKQLQTLTKTLQSYAKAPLFIAIDQEGGRVARLKKRYGFTNVAPSAKEVAKLPLDTVVNIYENQAKMLETNGINLNFAPVVDLCSNPNNPVIAKLERCYSNDPQIVSRYAAAMIDAHNKHHVISVLKHFPGHGSSKSDSHKGFVDISDTWDKKELKPYKSLIAQNKADMIMSAHVFNKHLDPTYPATLSYKINTKLLREKLQFRGVLVSDDMQMKAIANHYTLTQALTLAINSGVDMVIFGNQLEHTPTQKIIDTIFTQVKNGAIPLKRIQEANERIEALHTKNSIVQKPIIFKQERIEMSKAYIKKHYGLDVEDITIKPRMIVLHWTAVSDLNGSFERLYPQKLLSDRKDIAKASALNVSAHFLIDRDGTIYQLMDDNFMARHVIGLNYYAIGVENVGGKDNKEEDLTPKQVAANVKLVRYLKHKYPAINYLIGHHEYRNFENTPLWLERDAGYRTKKADPGAKFMHEVRSQLRDLDLKSRYEQ